MILNFFFTGEKKVSMTMGIRHVQIKDGWTLVQSDFQNRFKNLSLYKKNKVTKSKEYDGDNNMVININGNKYIYPPKAGIILFNQDMTKVLLVQNNFSDVIEKGKWGIPKGHMEDGEPCEKCANREFYEETGHNIDIKVGTKYLTVNNSKYYIYKLVNTTIDLNPVDTKEISDCKFIDLNEIDNLNLNKETRVLLTRKINLAKKYAIDISL